jgi:hypothetical protein
MLGYINIALYVVYCVMCACTVAGMVTPKVSMSTEGETLQVSVLPYRCSICAPLQRVSQELDYRIDICRVTKGAHIQHLLGRTETWSVSLSVDMLPFGVTVPATVPQGSEIPEGLMNNPV